LLTRTATTADAKQSGPPKEDIVLKLADCLSLIVAVLVSVSTAEALTDREKLEKLLKQHGVGVTSESTFDALIRASKAVCICHEPPLFGRAGVLTQDEISNDVVIFCTVPSFGKGGDSAGFSNCDAYAVIAK